MVLNLKGHGADKIGTIDSSDVLLDYTKCPYEIQQIDETLGIR